MNPLTRIELCKIIANEAAFYQNESQSNKIAEVYNKLFSDKKIFGYFETIGCKVTRMSGGRYYININLN